MTDSTPELELLRGLADLQEKIGRHREAYRDTPLGRYSSGQQAAQARIDARNTPTETSDR